MRRKDKEITDPEEIEKVIKEAEICRLAMVDGSHPYMIPLSFGIEGDSLYFHSGRKGMKLAVLRKNPNVCFEMDHQDAVLESEKPCEWSVRYRSVIGFGQAEFLEEASEKRDAFRIIMAHYSDRSFEFSDEMLQSVVIIRVKITDISAKQSGY